MSPEGRYATAMVEDARLILEAVGYGVAERPVLEVGIGLDVGPAWVGIVGEGEIRDFTAIGDVVNTAARRQAAAQGGQVVMSEAVADLADCGDGDIVQLEVKGKAEPGAARVVSV